MLKTVRAVRAVMLLTLCICLRAVVRAVTRAVRAVNTQVFDIVAGGKPHFAACARLVTTLLPRPRLLARRAWVSGSGTTRGIDGLFGSSDPALNSPRTTTRGA